MAGFLLPECFVQSSNGVLKSSMNYCCFNNHYPLLLITGIDGSVYFIPAIDFVVYATVLYDLTRFKVTSIIVRTGN